MRTDTSLIVVSRESAMPPGMRRFSKATKGVLAALAVLLVSFGTSAVAGDGPYVGIGGSLSILNDSTVSAPMREPYSTPMNLNATTKNGFAVRGMAGYAFTSGLRVEAEIDYRRHGSDKMEVRTPGTLVEAAAPIVAEQINDDFEAQGAPAPYPRGEKTTYADLQDAHKQLAFAGASRPQAVDGAFSMLAFMTNVDYDFDTGSRWVPYVGGGLGLAIISLDTESSHWQVVRRRQRYRLRVSGGCRHRLRVSLAGGPFNHRQPGLAILRDPEPDLHRGLDGHRVRCRNQRT